MDRMRELTVGAGVGLSCCGDEGEEEGRRGRGRMRDGGRRKERRRINEEKGKSVSEVRVGDLERGLVGEKETARQNARITGCSFRSGQTQVTVTV